AIAAEQLASAGKAELHVRLDERSLGFTALGAALASDEPSIIICTSGTAVANLHPAVLEASHSGVPLILITADRPHELHGVGANQTTDQVGIFADAVRVCFDVEAPTADGFGLDSVAEIVRTSLSAALGHTLSQPGPVQINLALREPLSALEPNAADVDALVLHEALVHTPEFAILDGSTPTVVIAGAEAGPEAVELAESFGWPLFAEPSSQARWGSNAILSYSKLLIAEPALAGRIGRAIVFGKPTLNRSVVRLLAAESVDVVVVRSMRMGHFDVTRRASAFVDEITVDSEVDFDWLRSWQVADQSYRLSAPVSPTLSRRELVEAIWEVTEGAENLVLGASRMIREADTWAPAKPINTFANRGLAGIDGTIATATGIALTTRLTTRVLLGDLTLLHDAGSLAIDPADGPLNIQLLVANDRGGSIFEALEMAQTLPATSFDRLFRTPQNVNLAKLAEAYGWNHISVDNEPALLAALALEGRNIIEVSL
ncbi:MAG: 2-succinyl-5-enolpyruvyl-6-hydroxy-3-cyclohexene-1-carboxylic-acid synthase, partial [Microbacteriaceae bacterium]|nr:2-succinyl-5-enolpyruvyl-6-hydroxy-3-cyclohexene-1-carboxylic-acid synthase [Microbacteriaceae bacterium]